MPRNSRTIDITYPSNRAKLPAEREPHWHRIAEGQHLGYRKLAANEGTWIARYRVAGKKIRRYKALGAADGPGKPANGTHVLSFQQALDASLRWFSELAKVDAAGVQIGPYTVADAAHDWLAAWTGSALSKANSEGNLRNHIAPALGRIEVAKLKRQEVQAWLQRLPTKPPVRYQRHKESIKKLPPSKRSKLTFDPNDPETIRKRRDTANRIFNDLSALLTMAYENGKVQSKAAWETVQKFENVDLAKNEYLTLEEAKRFIEACPQDFRDLVRAALIIGARYMDLAKLTVAAYDPQIKAISLVQGKTRKLKHIFLTDEEATFIEHMASGKRSNALLFTQLVIDADGKQIAKPWVKGSQQSRMANALKAAAIDRHVRFHDLRHTFGTLLALNGTSIQLIADQLGHSGTRIAEKHYAHYSPAYVASTVRANKPKLL
jgi:integrase